jgi:hypothetical protein
MLHGHAGRPALPALAELSEIGQHDIAQDGRPGQIGEQPVQDGLRGRFVESVQSLPQRGARPVPRRRGEGRPGGPAGRGTRVPTECSRP